MQIAELITLIADESYCVDVSDLQLDLSDSNFIYLVKSGRIDLMLQQVAADTDLLHLDPITSFEEDNLLFAYNFSEQEGYKLIAKQMPETKVFRVAKQKFYEFIHANSLYKEFDLLIKNWIQKLHLSLNDTIPSEVVLIEHDDVVELEAGDAVAAAKGLHWFKLECDQACYLGEIPCKSKYDYLVLPLTLRNWFESTCAANAEVISVAQLFQQQVIDYIICFNNELIFNHLVDVIQKRNLERLEIAKQQVVAKQKLTASSLSGILDVFSVKKKKVITNIEDDPMLCACKYIGDYLKITFKKPITETYADGIEKYLSAITSCSNIFSRRVLLKENWRKNYSGAILGFLSEDYTPVALLPDPKGKYSLYNSVTGETKVVTRKIELALADEAYIFHKPFPTDTVTLKDIFNLAMQFAKRDFIKFLSLGALIGVIGMAMPIVTAIIFDHVIPNNEVGILLQITLMLVLLQLVSQIYAYLKSQFLISFEHKVQYYLQSAVWDRILKIPINFFSKYTVGDLSDRANAIDEIQDLLSETTINSIMGVFFSIFSIILMFYFSSTLAWIGIGIVLIFVMVMTFASLIILRYERKSIQLYGKVDGILYQLIDGVYKIRSTGSEEAAFNHWAKPFIEHRSNKYLAEFWSAILTTFNSAYEIISLAMLYAAFAFIVGTDALSVGNFLAFSAAYAVFLNSTLQLSTIIESLAEVVPHYERIKPILTTPPENVESKNSPGIISGAIEVDNISFRYTEDTPYILKNLSIEINPGELVAIVGSSGAGKSTLFRLLLGFEQASQGIIYYDNKNIQELDTNLLRQQFGVVLQNGRLVPDSLLKNIIGESPLTRDDAWRVARMAGIADDIEEMPMGMETVISEGDGSISGGQRQRILIARALVHNPKILFLDEATSALDNETQAQVKENLDMLNITRVVIAHRLSTITEADRIYVLHQGQVAEVGTFDELVAQKGSFAQLAKRQSL